MPSSVVAQDWIVDTVPNLQIALTASQDNGEDDTIYVLDGFYDVSAAALSYEPAENFSLTIEGDGANTTFLDGGLSSAILTITNLTYNGAHVTIRDIAFWRGHNSVNAQLSGLAVHTVGQIRINHCVFTRHAGGAIHLTVTTGGAVWLINNIISGNNTPDHTVTVITNAAGVEIVNNTFVGNRSSGHTSSAISLESTHDFDILNIYNNIVWGEFVAEASFEVTTITGAIINSFNNIYRDWTLTGGGSVSEDNNIDDDPLFVTDGVWDDNGTPTDTTDDIWTGGDYHLQHNSPAVDTGENTAPSIPATDFDGNLRIYNLIVDRGAYEYRPVATPPDIDVTDSQGDANDLSIDFGNVLVGVNSSIETVAVFNDGTTVLNIGSVVQPAAPFTVTSDACSNLPLSFGSVGCIITLQFSPTAVGNFTDTLSIPSDDPDEPLVVVTLSGTGVSAPLAPNITVSPLTLFFDSVLVGASSPPLELTISNTGNAVLQVSDMTLATGTDFTLDVNGGSTPCGTTQPMLIMGSNCTVTVRFAPQSTGSLLDILTISSNDPDEPTVDVFLNGNGVTTPTPNLYVYPLQHDFNDVIVGTSSTPLIVTLSNSDNFDLHVSDMSFSTGTHYQLNVNGGTAPCGSTAPVIPGHANCTVSVTFEPQSLGRLVDTLTIFSDDPHEPTVDVSLSGGGVSGPTPDISVSPMSLVFLSRRDWQEVTISNVGNADLHVADISLTTGTQYWINVDLSSNPCGSIAPVITPGGYCIVSVEFNPDLQANELDEIIEDTLVITSDDWNEPEVIVELTELMVREGSSSRGICASAMSGPEGEVHNGTIVFLVICVSGLLLWRRIRRR